MCPGARVYVGMGGPSQRFERAEIHERTEDELGEKTARYAGFSAFYNVPALYGKA